MFTLRRILWPTDFSELSRRALPVVNELASRFSAHVDVLHVLAPPPSLVTMTGQGAVTATEYLTTLDERAETSIQETLQRDIAQGVDVSSTILSGRPPHEIVEFAADRDIDLIILATHGETGFSRLVFGSVAEKVVRLAPCPVLTVPGPADDDSE